MGDAEPKAMSRKPERGAPIVRSAARAIRILGVLVRNPEGVSLGEIAESLDLDRATAHRLLRTLVSERVAAQDPDSRHYRFSAAAWIQMAPYLAGGSALTQAAQEIVDALAQRTEATCILSFIDETRRSMVAAMHALSPRPLRLDPTTVSSVPAHTVGAGKCFLAGLSEDEFEEWLKGGLPQSTDTTITSVEQLREEIAQVRAQGYGFSRAEAIAGVFGLAVPVRDDAGRVFGGLALGTTEPDVAQKLTTWLPLLRRGAKAISDLLARGLAPPVGHREEQS
jgi:DNA-binding IclR family transcriptional regulator